MTKPTEVSATIDAVEPKSAKVIALEATATAAFIALVEQLPRIPLFAGCFALLRALSSGQMSNQECVQAAVEISTIVSLAPPAIGLLLSLAHNRRDIQHLFDKNKKKSSPTT